MDSFNHHFTYGWQYNLDSLTCDTSEKFSLLSEDTEEDPRRQLNADGTIGKSKETRKNRWERDSLANGENKNGLSAVEFESASVQIDVHPRRALPVRASRVRRPKLRAGCASMDQDADRQDVIGRDPTRQPPSTHLRPVSMNQPATARQRRQPPIAGRPARVSAKWH